MKCFRQPIGLGTFDMIMFILYEGFLQRDLHNLWISEIK